MELLLFILLAALIGKENPSAINNVELINQGNKIVLISHDLHRKIELTDDVVNLINKNSDFLRDLHVNTSKKLIINYNTNEYYLESSSFKNTFNIDNYENLGNSVCSYENGILNSLNDVVKQTKEYFFGPYIFKSEDFKGGESRQLVGFDRIKGRYGLDVGSKWVVKLTYQNNQDNSIYSYTSACKVVKISKDLNSLGKVKDGYSVELNKEAQLTKVVCENKYNEDITIDSILYYSKPLGCYLKQAPDTITGDVSHFLF